jgi:hypothetical protein
VDTVTKPQHYQAGGIETIEVIRAKLGPEGFGYYCEGNVLKYLTRWRYKGGVEDLRKAQVYLDWLLTEAQIKPASTDQPVPPLVTLHEDDDEPERVLNFDKPMEHA